MLLGNTADLSGTIFTKRQEPGHLPEGSVTALFMTAPGVQWQVWHGREDR